MTDGGYTLYADKKERSLVCRRKRERYFPRPQEKRRTGLDTERLSARKSRKTAIRAAEEMLPITPRLKIAARHKGYAHPARSGENGRSGVHAPHNSRVTQSTGTSRGSQKSNGPRGTRTDQPYGATFRFQKITPEMAAKHRVEQQKIRSGADGRAGVGSRDIRGGRSGGAGSNSTARSTGSNGTRSSSVTRSPARGGTSKNRRGSSLTSPAAPSGAAVIRSRLTARRMPTIRTVQSRVVRRFPLKIILIALLCTVLFLLIIYNNVQLNEKNSKVDELKSTVVELDSKLSELTLKVEKKDDLREIEQRALERTAQGGMS